MNGPKIVVHGNAQDGSGNTMNEGQIIIHGHAGDVTGQLDERRKNLYPRLRWLPRWHTHERVPTENPPNSHRAHGRRLLSRVHGRRNNGYLGLNLKEGEKCNAKFVGTGMHGGVIYERGEILNLLTAQKSWMSANAT